MTRQLDFKIYNLFRSFRAICFLQENVGVYFFFFVTVFSVVFVTCNRKPCKQDICGVLYLDVSHKRYFKNNSTRFSTRSNIVRVLFTSLSSSSWCTCRAIFQQLRVISKGDVFSPSNGPTGTGNGACAIFPISRFKTRENRDASRKRRY